MKHETLEYGEQPLDALMLQHELTNKDLASRSETQLTFKVIKKARKGRRLTRRTQEKVLSALNACLTDPVPFSAVFNYKG